MNHIIQKNVICTLKQVGRARLNIIDFLHFFKASMVLCETGISFAVHLDLPLNLYADLLHASMRKLYANRYTIPFSLS